MAQVKNKILNNIKQALDYGIKDVLLASNTPEDEKELLHGVPRIGIVLTGQISYHFSQDGQLKNGICEQGGAFYCSPRGYLYSNHHIDSSYLSTSLVYYGEYIRIVSTKYDKDSLNEDTYYYHTDIPLSKLGRELLKILDNLAANKENQKVAAKLIEALLMVSLNDIKKSCVHDKRILSHLFVEINNVLRLHHDQTMSLKMLAKRFRFSPSYMSHFIKKQSGKDFTSIITEYRLEHAVNLLCKTRLSVDEIAQACGFNYTSYFITCFKKYYNATPRSFCKKFNKKGGKRMG